MTGAIFDLVTFGRGGMALKRMGYTKKEEFGALIKTMVVDLAANAGTDGAVFWRGNKEGAVAYANSIGGTMMEQTPGGR